MPALRGRRSVRKTGTVRIVGGSWRSRLIDVASRPDLRPTPARVRETLFNWLGQDLHGLDCLDLFAGSGVLGFEAASRGARNVLLVENDPLTAVALEQARKILAAPQVEIVRTDAFAFLSATRWRFDVVFLDPPFRQNAAGAILENLPGRLVPGARVYVEAQSPISPRGPWRELRRRRAGQVSYQLLEWCADDTCRISGNI